ncbi:MAG TPA: MlaD family protein [Acidimicrobiales bacterium]|jgi:phospholipid/cholesterol/gamma-HCH transport system substrate-binding protein|nr:MlaD family protein [Acidimicrobiales bacterium]
MAGRRWLAVPAAAALALALALASCGTSGSAPQHSASAVFSDIGDLASGAQVQLADVPVGTVSNIALDGNKAKITLQFNSGVRIPADVSASIARTTILGDQFVELNVPKSEIGPGSAHAPELANGAVIHHTSVVPDVEQFIQAGAGVFGAVSATQLEQIVEAGGEGFTGQEAALKSFLTNISTVANGYANHTSEITTAVHALNQLSSTLAPTSSATADALTTLSKTVAILAQNSNQFETLLQSLNDLSVQGRSILENFYPQIVTQLNALQAVTSQVSQHQADLAGLLEELPVANAALPSGVRNGFVQLYENIIVCGIPGGGEDDNAPAFSCLPKKANSK